jgi:hypothetical protein
MDETLTLPTGETVTPEDVFLFNDYPYRFVPVESEAFAFELTPLYWGGSGMDIPFEDRSALADQWGPDSEGLMTDAEWRSWLASARRDDRFDDEELDAIAAEVLDESLLERLRRTLGF